MWKLSVLHLILCLFGLCAGSLWQKHHDAFISVELWQVCFDAAIEDVLTKSNDSVGIHSPHLELITVVRLPVRDNPIQMVGMIFEIWILVNYILHIFPNFLFFSGQNKMQPEGILKWSRIDVKIVHDFRNCIKNRIKREFWIILVMHYTWNGYNYHFSLIFRWACQRYSIPIFPNMYNIFWFIWVVLLN